MGSSLDKSDTNAKKVPWYAYLVLVLTIIFLSGLAADSPGPLKALDFNNIAGSFGSMAVVEEGANLDGVKFANDFKGIGGTGVRDGFLLALTAGPSIILALAVVQIYNDYKGVLAAEKLFSPILKPVLGVPGAAALGIIASLTSADAGAGVANNIYENGTLTQDELAIVSSFMFSAPAILVNFFMFTSAITPYMDRSITIALGVILIMKFVGAITTRIVLNLLRKKEAV